MWTLNCDCFKAKCDLEGPKDQKTKMVRFTQMSCVYRLILVIFTAIVDGFTGGVSRTPAQGPRRFLPFSILRSRGEECAEEKQQPEDPALISYLIYFSPDRGFGFGEGLKHFGCFSWALWGWKEGSRGEESRGGQGDWLSWGIRSASGSWIKSSQDPPCN